MSVSDVAGRMIFKLAGYVLLAMWQVLVFLSHLSFAACPVVITEYWRLILILAGVVLMLAPSGFPCRWLGGIWVLPVFFWHPAPPASGTAAFTLLETGQGLSAVIQTSRHVLVFDAGPAFGSGFDAGMEIVTPYLRSRGIRQIDTLVVSHGDSDHAGGVRALLNAFQVNALLTSVPERMPVAASYCLQGNHWEWDGVRFEFLYPDRSDLLAGNESSCVLKVITLTGQSVLLTGDIEKNAERKLLAHGASLASNVIVVPHHGSKTSSTEDFVSAVHPDWALFSVGYQNRYHFPHPEVVKRYRKTGAVTLTTTDTGAIWIFLGKSDIKVSTSRQNRGHFW